MKPRKDTVTHFELLREDQASGICGQPGPLPEVGTANRKHTCTRERRKVNCLVCRRVIWSDQYLLFENLKNNLSLEVLDTGKELGQKEVSLRLVHPVTGEKVTVSRIVL